MFFVENLCKFMEFYHKVAIKIGTQYKKLRVFNAIDIVILFVKTILFLKFFNNINASL